MPTCQTRSPRIFCCVPSRFFPPFRFSLFCLWRARAFAFLSAHISLSPPHCRPFHWDPTSVQHCGLFRGADGARHSALGEYFHVRHSPLPDHASRGGSSLCSFCVCMFVCGEKMEETQHNTNSSWRARCPPDAARPSPPRWRHIVQPPPGYVSSFLGMPSLFSFLCVALPSFPRCCTNLLAHAWFLLS